MLIKMDEQSENTSEIGEMLLKIREILEEYIMDTTGEKSFEKGISSLEKDYEVIENSLSTLLNYLALQQNVVRSFRNIEQFTRAFLCLFLVLGLNLIRRGIMDA